MSDNRVAIELRGVTKEFPGLVALKGIDLKVEKETIHGFLGPNGAGKSTAMNIISGLIPATSGDVRVLGKEVESDINFVKASIGILPEHPPLYHNMTVEDYLVFSQRIHGHEDRQHLNMIIERTGLEAVKKRLIGNLSKGYKQRVGMAQALSYHAKIIILDEPMVGLDPQAIAQMRELILELKKDHTILLSTHQLYEAAKVCDDVTIIQDGVIKKAGRLKDIEHELLGFKSYVAHVTDVSNDLVSKLESLAGVKEVVIADRDQGKFVEIRTKSDQDIRGALTKAIVGSSELLEFKASQLDLEEIFKQVTSHE